MIDFKKLLSVTHPDCLFTISNDTDYATIVWDSNNNYPLPEEAYLIEWHALVLSNYSKYRAEAYPSLEDQADMQFHDSINGTSTWQIAIQEVKDKYPKEVTP